MSGTTEKETIRLTPAEQQQAAEFIAAMGGNVSEFTTERGVSAPPAINAIFERVLRCIGEGLPISISTLPKEVTTTTAASMLSMSRPTLMKHVRDSRIPAHMVGSHHRLLSQDVLKFQEELKAERRKAVFDLMDLETELGETID